MARRSRTTHPSRTDAMTTPIGHDHDVTGTATSATSSTGDAGTQSHDMHDHALHGAAAGTLGGTPSHGRQAGAQDGDTAQVAGQVKEKAREFAGKATEQAKTKARTTVESGKERAAETVAAFAETLRGGDRSRIEENEQVMRFLGAAADRMEHLADYLRTTETDELVRQAESLARRQPAVFLGGAFMLGVLGARFLKSSRRAQVEQGMDRELPIAMHDERQGFAATGMDAGGAWTATGHPDATTGVGASTSLGMSGVAGGARHDALHSTTSGLGDAPGGSAFGGAASGSTMHTTDPIDDLDAARPSGLGDHDTTR